MPSPGWVDMDVSWKGLIQSGKVRIEFSPPEAKKNPNYVVRFSASSTGAAALFPYQTHFWSEMDPRTLRPRFFEAVEVTKKEKTTITARHSPERVDSTESTRILKTGTLQESRRFFEFPEIFDCFSAMLHVRSQRLATGDRISLVIHPFDTPYLLNLHVVGREFHQNRQTIRLKIRLQKINRKTLELVPYHKIKGDTSLWLSDDRHRIPVELRAAARFGEIRATLVDSNF